MVTAVRHGESGGRRARIFPYLLIRLLQAACVCAIFALAWHASPAHAGSMYRCQGGSGETVFTSSRVGYKHCHRIRVDGGTSSAHARSAHAATDHGAGKASWHYSQGTADHAPRMPEAAVGNGKAQVLRGAVYRVVHADGSIEYTNVRPRGRHAHGAVTRTLFTYIATCVACNVHSDINWKNVPLRLTAYAGAIHSAATEYGVDAALLRAVIHAESAFNPNAVSAKGAQGLMQLMPATATDMGVKNAFDATDNIRGGARYLAQLLKIFKGNDQLAAAAYNAGPDAVHKYGGVPPYAETEVYVRRVTLLHERYRQALEHSPTVASATGPGHAD